MDMQIKYIDPVELIPYGNNPRVNGYAIKKVMESIKEFGFKNPIIVDKDMVVIAGHTRREASLLLGLTEVPYIIADDLTEKQVKAYRIADNKLAELSSWDEQMLKVELEDLMLDEFNLETIGFTEIDLTLLFKEEEVKKEKEPKVEKTTLPMLRFGANSIRITPDECTLLSNKYNEYVEENPEQGFIYWILGLEG